MAGTAGESLSLRDATLWGSGGNTTVFCPDPDDLEVGQLIVGIWSWIISLNRVVVSSLMDLRPLLCWFMYDTVAMLSDSIRMFG